MGAPDRPDSSLCFLHADSQLPTEARGLMEFALADPAVVGGRFDLRFDRPSIWGHIISTLMNPRSRLTRIATGDQAMFVRRQIFERLGGFPGIPLMEDIDLSSRLKRTGPTAALSEYVTTSFSRWERRPLANDPLDVGFCVSCIGSASVHGGSRRLYADRVLAAGRGARPTVTIEWIINQKTEKRLFPAPRLTPPPSPPSSARTLGHLR